MYYPHYIPTLTQFKVKAKTTHTSLCKLRILRLFSVCRFERTRFDFTFVIITKQSGKSSRSCFYSPSQDCLAVKQLETLWSLQETRYHVDDDLRFHRLRQYISLSLSFIWGITPLLKPNMIVTLTIMSYRFFGRLFSLIIYLSSHF